MIGKLLCIMKRKSYIKVLWQFILLTEVLKINYTTEKGSILKFNISIRSPKRVRKVP